MTCRNSLAGDGSLQVEFEKTEFDNLVEVANKGVEDAVDVGRVDAREVGRCEGALRPAVALIHDALARCNTHNILAATYSSTHLTSFQL